MYIFGLDAVKSSQVDTLLIVLAFQSRNCRGVELHHFILFLFSLTDFPKLSHQLNTFNIHAKRRGKIVTN